MANEEDTEQTIQATKVEWNKETGRYDVIEPGVHILRCPYNDCDGELALITDMSTDAFYISYDKNHHSESFQCLSCRKAVTRHWRWKSEEAR